MTKDSERSHVHLALPRSILFFEEWMKLPLEFDNIYVPPELEPPNPDNDSGLLLLGPGRPAEQAPFGIHKSLALREKSMKWRELALAELLTNGPHNLLNREEMIDFAPSIEGLEKEFPDVTVSGPKPSGSLFEQFNNTQNTEKSKNSNILPIFGPTSERLNSRGTKHSSILVKKHPKSILKSSSSAVSQSSSRPSNATAGSNSSAPYSPLSNNGSHIHNPILHTPISSMHASSGVAHTMNHIGASSSMAHSHSGWPEATASASSTPFHHSTLHTQMPPPQIRRANHIRRTPFRTPGRNGDTSSVTSTSTPSAPGSASGRRTANSTSTSASSGNSRPGTGGSFDGDPGSHAYGAVNHTEAYTPTTPGSRHNERRESRMGSSAVAGRRKRPSAPR